MTFTADAELLDNKRGEEQRFEMDTAGTAGESMIQPSITPGESGGVTTPVTTDPAPPHRGGGHGCRHQPGHCDAIGGYAARYAESI